VLTLHSHDSRERKRQRQEELEEENKKWANQISLLEDEIQKLHLQNDLHQHEKEQLILKRAHSNGSTQEVEDHIPSESPRAFIANFGVEPAHKRFTRSSEVPLQYVASLGHGSLGVVDEVRTYDADLPTLVRKRVRLERWNAKRRLEILQLEVESMRRLKHPHIVKIIGTYEDDVQERIRFFSILMSPVGEADLKTLLFRINDDIDRTENMPPDEVSTNSYVQAEEHIQELQRLRSWFSCLSSALAYIHDQGIRHQDIKPSNIIYRGTTVYFADFSSASHFEVGQTTSTYNPAATSTMYRAPEVANPVLHDQKGNYSLQRHGRATDVFSLGCVFMEMLVVLDGGLLSDFHNDCVGSGGYGNPLKPMSSWFTYDDLSLANKGLYQTIVPLLYRNRKKRPLASELPSRFCWVRLCDPTLDRLKCSC
jgi:serine/threonine protein kinase